MKSGNPFHHLLLRTGGALLLLTQQPVHGEVIAAWETTGQSSFGTQGLPVTGSAPGLSVGGLTRGPGVTTSGSSIAPDAWGGRGFHATTVEAAVAAGSFITFTVTPGSGTEVTFETFDLHYRRSANGPLSAALQFQLGAGDFIEVEEIPLDEDDNAGSTINPVDLTVYSELEGVSGQTVTFRLVPYGASNASGAFYLYGPTEGDDLLLEGQVSGGSGGDTTPPLISGLLPADNATDVPGASTTLLTMTFNENIGRGTGQILVKRTATGQVAYSLDVTDPAQVTLSVNQLGLVLPAALDPGTDYHVEVPAGAVVDTASPANPFAGFATSSTWNFSTAVLLTPPRVVVNKFLNGTPDRVELLVVGNGSPGSTVDLRGMILKDFSGDMTGDGGGKFVFTESPLWASVAAGTLVSISNTAFSPDTSAVDFQLAVGLTDPALFAPVPGSPPLDLTAVDMIMIKGAGSPTAGTTGGIHALAAGTASPTSFFTLFSGPKLRATATAGNNLGVRASNSTSTLADYMTGTDAIGNLPLVPSDFGSPNNGPNAVFLATLRGLTAGDGDGVATVMNATLTSPFLGLPFFDDAQSAQAARLTVLPRIEGITLATVRITVPPELGAPASISLAGPAAAGAQSQITGQTVLITSTALTTSAALEVTINGLSTPSPTRVSDNGNYPLEVATATAGGSFTPISRQPPLIVIIPIASLRDVDGEGSSPDVGTAVAVEGIVTEAEFGAGAANFSGYLQDGTAGINVFSPSLFLGLVRGNVFVVHGTVSQTNGLTSIIPASSSHIVNRQTVPEAVPTAVTLAALHANPETFEGRLITVANLSPASGLWAPGATLILTDPAENLIEIRIQPGSTATSPPPFPATVTGIFGQSDETLPYNSGYFLMPRDPDDLAETIDDFGDWLTETGATGGPADDPDFDGKDNAFEYAFGLDPTSGADAHPITSELERATGKFTYTRRLFSLTTLNYKIFTSTTLDAWTEDLSAVENVIATVGNIETVEVTLSGPKPITAPKFFLRIVAN